MRALQVDETLLAEIEAQAWALELFEQGLSVELVICCTGLSAAQIVKLRHG